jgi:hypothetical protein
MYNAQYFFVANQLNRYTLSQRNNFYLNPDSSVDLYIQHEPPPTSQRANWLPAPEGNFKLMLRLYWPKEALVTGSWEPLGSTTRAVMNLFAPATSQAHH